MVVVTLSPAGTTQPVRAIGWLASGEAATQMVWFVLFTKVTRRSLPAGWATGGATDEEPAGTTFTGVAAGVVVTGDALAACDGVAWVADGRAVAVRAEAGMLAVTTAGTFADAAAGTAAAPPETAGAGGPGETAAQAVAITAVATLARPSATRRAVHLPRVMESPLPSRACRPCLPLLRSRLGDGWGRAG
jgi:hypothetical protein